MICTVRSWTNRAVLARIAKRFMLTIDCTKRSALINHAQCGLMVIRGTLEKDLKKTTVAEWNEKAKKQIEEDLKNPCAGCEFRKYHDWLEPTWTGPSQHHYDCEKPGCPMWSRLWWRKNDDGTTLMDQQPIRLTRKFQHAVYEIVRFLNEIVEWLLN